MPPCLLFFLLVKCQTPTEGILVSKRSACPVHFLAVCLPARMSDYKRLFTRTHSNKTCEFCFGDQLSYTDRKNTQCNGTALTVQRKLALVSSACPGFPVLSTTTR